MLARQLNELMRDEARVFALFASLSVEYQLVIDELPVVREFLEVSPDEIPDVPLFTVENGKQLLIFPKPWN